MVVALGLGRLEKELVRDPAAVADVDEFLERTGGVDMHTLAAEGMPEALEYLHRREAQQSAGPAPPASAAPVHRPPATTTHEE